MTAELEQLQEDVNTLFTERSLVTALVPNRDVGVQLGAFQPQAKFWLKDFKAP